MFDDVSGDIATDFDELFPLLSLRCCRSDAAGSTNGPRYSAQDRFTGIVHEVRAIRVDRQLRRSDGGGMFAVKQRLKLLQDAAKLVKAVHLVLPEDAYLTSIEMRAHTNNDRDGHCYAVSVGPQCGLSLHDLILAGRTTIAYRHFVSLLGCVAHYISVHESLPVHGNITMECIMLTSDSDFSIDQSSSADVACHVTWCIGDWSLLPLSHRTSAGASASMSGVFAGARTVEDLQMSFTAVLTAFTSRVRVVDSAGHFVAPRLVTGEISDALTGDGLRKYIVQTQRANSCRSRGPSQTGNQRSPSLEQFVQQLDDPSVTLSPTNSCRSLERVVAAQRHELTKDVELYEKMRRRAREEALRNSKDVSRVINDATSVLSPVRFEVPSSTLLPDQAAPRVYIVPSPARRDEKRGRGATVEQECRSPDPLTQNAAPTSTSGDSPSLSPAPCRLISESVRDNSSSLDRQVTPSPIFQGAPHILQEVRQRDIVIAPLSKPRPRIDPSPATNGPSSGIGTVKEKPTSSRCCTVT